MMEEVQEKKEIKEVIKQEWPRNKVKQLKETVGDGEIVRFVDEVALRLSDEGTTIDAKKCAYGMRRFLQERNSVIVLGLDEELQQMYNKPKKEKKPEPVKELETLEVVIPKTDENSVCQSSNLDNRTEDFETISLAAEHVNKRNMLEIFNFYCNKFLDQKGDFDNLRSNRKVLGLNGYNAFVKDFKLPLTGS